MNSLGLTVDSFSESAHKSKTDNQLKSPTEGTGTSTVLKFRF